MKELVNDGNSDGAKKSPPGPNLAMRKSWQELSAEDEKLIGEVDQLLEDKIDDLIATMYGHFLAFPQIEKLFPNPETLRRAQKAQAKYFLRLTKGNYDEEYVADRLRVGSTHYRIGLDPQWYLGAYRLILSWFRKQLVEHFNGRPEKVLACINALTKVIFFDMSLAIESYMNAKEEAIEKQREAIADLESARQQQREDFVATLTHDLKTPILATNRAVELLIAGDFGPVLEEQSQVLQTIHESNESLYNLVQTLLEVYRYESGSMQLSIEKHDLEKIINKLVSELEPLAKAKNIQMLTRIPKSIKEAKCDAAEIRRVVQNFIDNSLKFTAAGGQIIVSIEQINDETIIAVQDTGQGIRKEDKSKLFQRFWQATSGGRYHAGTGLGLYLCRQIIEKHGGRIWCNSELGHGSTFAFGIAT